MTWVYIGLCWLFFVTCTTSSTTVNISEKEAETISSATASMSISAITAKLESHTTESSSYREESQYESISSENYESSDESQSTVSTFESSEVSRSDRESQYESIISEKYQSSEESQSTDSSWELSEVSCPDREKFCAGKPNEEYTKEKKSCPPEICGSLVSRYDCSDAPPPSPGCACLSGYLRLNETSPCIAICDCPEMASSPDCLHQKPTCTDPNEEFIQEKSTCPGDTCEALVAKYDCCKAPPPEPGCTCKSGYRRLKATSLCVPICDCPQMANSAECQKPKKHCCKDPNEEYVQKKRNCPPEMCISLVSKYDCSKFPPPKPGCACKSGYLRLNASSPCIPMCKCPQIANTLDCLNKSCKGPNEEFVQEKSTCPGDTCEALVAKYDCCNAPPPEPGCTCKSGYRRLKATSQCVPICDCPQMANSAECQKPKHCCKGPNEEYVQKKRNCPPEMCISLVSKYDCSKFPPPKPGCACKSGYLRLNASSPCIPMCKCPQIANTLDCLNKSCKGPNEEFVQEKSTCPGDTCEALVAKYDCCNAPPPEPGCTCKSGYRRLKATSQCVPICDCPQMANSAECQKPKKHCCKGPNEEYVQKKRNCPPEMCISLVSKYDCSKFPPPKPGCACKSGYLRLNASSPCIPMCKCPQIANTLDCLNKSCKGPNEEFVQEKSTCPGDTCEALVAKYDCCNAPPPEPGCTCKSGYRRLKATSQCVPICDCPQMANSAECQKPKHCCKGPNEEYVQKKRNCPPEMCISLVSKYDCSKFPPPKPGCACKSGYLRLNASSPCIPMCKCPQIANTLDCLNKSCKGPNEEFVQEKSTCPGDTCEALVARYDCCNAPPPEPGCTCKSGYRRLKATSLCVPICDCPQMANSAECQKPKKHCCKGPNEEYVQKKRNCPPETCISIVSKYDCSKFPPPKPGCACKSGYLRLNASSPCIPMCKCPQIANTLDCLNKSCKGPNEEFVQEKSTCPGDTCEALVAKYDCCNAPPPEPGCTCKSGYRRLKATSQCVPICDCPQMANSAECQKPKKHCCKGPNEEYVQKKRNCPPEMCISLVSKYDCSKFPPPKPGCACKSGYLRLNASSPCIPMCKCPQIANTLDCLNKSCKGPNEEFVQEKSTCPGDTCEALVAKYDCCNAPPPEPGCTCKSGYRRLKATSQCVPICDCPQMANSAECQKPKHCCKGPNEEYVQKKRNCPPEMCISLVSKYDCSKFPPPKPGCACKSGYLRLNASSPCIPMCKCPQIANTLDCLNKSCKGPNEEFVQEKSTCPGDTCEALVARYDCCNAPPPEPGCTCKSGYRRLKATSLCVPICDCPQMANSAECQKPKKHCCKGPNEEYVQKKRNCPPETCISIVSKYDCSKFPPPKPGCACKSGYLRLNASSPCIPMCKCPQIANTLDCLNKSCKGPNEEFVQEKSTCPGDTCEALVAKYDCCNAPPPEPGCTCKSGYRRLKATSQCVPICDCPQMANSAECQKPKKHCCKGPNEEYVQKKRNCPPETCISIVSKYDCSKFPPPKPGCACKSGYLRLNASSPCIPMCKCPQIANTLDCLNKSCKGPNEEFVQEKSTCPGDTCEALVAKYDCCNAPPPEPGCTCKSGYRRLKATSQCVPICDCPQMANSAECQKPKHCCKGPNEEYVQKKRNCPPETTTITKYDCEAQLSRCGQNEVEECVKPCPPERTCRNKGIMFRCKEDPRPCKKKCVCAKGYYRNAIGECIRGADCDKCTRPNEFFSCGGACDNECINIDTQNRTSCPIKNIVCNKKCYCEDGYARDAAGNCIPVNKCKSQSLNCGQYEVEKCVQACPPEVTCRNKGIVYDCQYDPRPCKKKCVCAKGYYRNAIGECITGADCDKCTRPNEFFSCGSACDNECNVYTQNRTTCPIINIVCNKKCYCEDGYARDKAGNCIPVDQCNAPCRDPNEVYECGKSCPPDLCFSLVARFKCDSNEVSRYRCTCKPGYKRLKDGSPCIPICECPEMKNSPDC